MTNFAMPVTETAAQSSPNRYWYNDYQTTFYVIMGIILLIILILIFILILILVRGKSPETPEIPKPAVLEVSKSPTVAIGKDVF